jgi:diguanylate cyclase (GGDEF)-like protein
MSQVDVCLIDDDADQLQLISAILRRAGYSVSEARDYEEALRHIAEYSPKVVITDYHLPDGTGLDICRSLREDPQAPETYCVLTTATAADQLDDSVLEQGADDYLAKPFDDNSVLARVRVGLRIRKMRSQLRTAAITDGLTGLYNHDHLNQIIEVEMSRSQRYGHPLALMMIDVDHFKSVNDTFGHLAGNEVLEAFARLLRETVREVDTCGRFGGDEFAVVLPEASAADAMHLAERFRARLRETSLSEGLRGHQPTASFGIADVDDPRVKNAADLVDLADRALYVAKRGGRDQVVCGTQVATNRDPGEVIQKDEIESLRRQVAVLSLRAKDVYIQSVSSLLQALDEMDPYTARHSTNVAHYAEGLAANMGCSRALVQNVRSAALLHDVGKVGVPNRILMKRTKLSTFERMVMDQVPIIGTRIVDHLRILEAELPIIRHQREYYDGSGIPHGLAGDRIPLGARILLVADAFDAMTTDRVYRTRRPIDHALAEIRTLAGTQFDPKVVRALEEVLATSRDTWQHRIDDTIRHLELPTQVGGARADTGLPAPTAEL